MIEQVRVETGRYHDSVTLMRASAAGAEVDGVEAVIAAMATELNVGLLHDAGFPVDDVTADDLVVAVRAGDDAAADAAVAAVEAALSERPRSTAGRAIGPLPHTIEAALVQAPEAGVVVVSVPGPHAWVEAMAAVRAGRHVMVFSDGVDVQAEVVLKQAAADAGVLVMGPDCGTVVLSGVGLGFANVVVPGPVGIVAASGTGAQQLCGLLDGAGIGVRHVLGVGGRDLSAAVGGRSTLAALAALDEDPAVEVIALVSKPPDPEVAQRVADAAAACRTPVVLALVGEGGSTLTDAAAEVAARLGRTFGPPASWAPPVGPSSVGPSSVGASPGPGPLLGLFSGGTNCLEAVVVVEELVGEVRSNVHPEAGRRIGPRDDPGGGHVLLDLGDDELTAGRPHPMIDPTLVVERLAAASAQHAGVVLLDVVLGHGAHPAPATVLVPAIADAVRAGRAVVVTLVGTAGDPQGLERQAKALAGAGAAVHRSNAEAARTAAALVSSGRSRP